MVRQVRGIRKDRYVLFLSKEEKDAFAESVSSENRMKLLPDVAPSHVVLRLIRVHERVRPAAHRSGRPAVMAVEELAELFEMADDVGKLEGELGSNAVQVVATLKNILSSHLSNGNGKR